MVAMKFHYYIKGIPRRNECFETGNIEFYHL